MKLFIILTINVIIQPSSVTTVKFNVEESHLGRFICTKLCPPKAFQLYFTGFIRKNNPKEDFLNPYLNPCILCLHVYNACRRSKSLRKTLDVLKYYPNYYRGSISDCTCPIDNNVLHVLRVIFWTNAANKIGKCNVFTKLRIACCKRPFSTINYECFIWEDLMEVNRIRSQQYRNRISKNTYRRNTKNNTKKNDDVVEDDEEEDDFPEDIAIEEDNTMEAEKGPITTEVIEQDEIHQEQVKEILHGPKNLTENEVENIKDNSNILQYQIFVILVNLLINL